jgi:hypothetical protein
MEASFRFVKYDLSEGFGGWLCSLGFLFFSWLIIWGYWDYSLDGNFKLNSPDGIVLVVGAILNTILYSAIGTDLRKGPLVTFFYMAGSIVTLGLLRRKQQKPLNCVLRFYLWSYLASMVVIFFWLCIKGINGRNDHTSYPID